MSLRLVKPPEDPPPVPLDSLWLFSKKAALCIAVAAAARRAAWFRADCNLCAQSGLIWSVVTTSGADEESAIFRRSPEPCGGLDGERGMEKSGECAELPKHNGDKDSVYTNPRRNDGGE